MGKYPLPVLKTRKGNEIVSLTLIFSKILEHIGGGVGGPLEKEVEIIETRTDHQEELHESF